jgi:hypothetical protein
MENIRDLVGFESTHTISDLGIIRRKKDASYQWRKEVLKPTINNNGYAVIGICKKSYFVHRLVAMTFIENPLNLPCVNHISGDKQDNRVTNLVWCTYSENQKHAYSNLGKIAPLKDKHGKEHHRSKAIKQLDKEGNTVKVYESVIDAMKDKGISRHIITKALLNSSDIDGYYWLYA